MTEKDLEKFLEDKTYKAKEKTGILSAKMLNGELNMNVLVKIADKCKDPVKAICVEAMEFATKKNPSVATIQCLDFVSESLTSKAPRVKWESAKVIGNIASFFPGKLDTAFGNLLANSEDKGTVVRWSAAFALGEIIMLKNKQAKELIPALEAICKREEKNSIKKIYLKALKNI